MRRLLYVPVVHDEADLGSAGAALARDSVRQVGEQRWARHQQVLGQFWEQIAAFLGALDPHQLKVYQDGLPADGEVGRRIIEEAARRGSRNHRLVLHLLSQGAELRTTESPQLLWQEHQRLLGAMPATGGNEGDAGTLMRQRDKFIADIINATLKEGDIGVLFIGAHHEVAPQLAKDIVVEAVKDPLKVRAYFEALFVDSEGPKFAKLARCLTSPIHEKHHRDREAGAPT